MKYHPLQIWNLTYGIWGHCLVGSLTGVVASKSVTEAFKGTLRTVGNRLVRAISEGCLTVRRTCRAGRKLGYSDPVVLYGRAIAQRIPRCRLVTSWGWRRSQGLGCSPIKVARELGSERRETVRSLSVEGAGDLRGSDFSTRGPSWTDR